MSEQPRNFDRKRNELTNGIILYLHDTQLSINCKIYMAHSVFHFLTVWPTLAKHPLLE
jgi:hypothetical protein